MRETLFEYCTRHGREYLLDQWHKEKNQDKTPSDVSYGSKRKVWWLCKKGHAWEAAVYSRTSIEGGGCPYCAGRFPLPGEDLLTLRPNVAKQWDSNKNGKLRPEQVTIRSHRSVWWLCEKGHSWCATVNSRVRGTGCPVCVNKIAIAGENDLATTHPQLVKEWCVEKNLPFTPQSIVSGSTRKMWWRCGKGHEWKAAIASRASGSGCPVCANKKIIAGENDLASAYPYLAVQWLQEKNAELRPNQVAVGSNKRVWWQCTLGHQWQATVASRTIEGNDCPVCGGKKVLPGFNDLRSQMPEIARDWHPVLNGKLKPDQVTVGSRRKVWWTCQYGHVWKAVISSRTGKTKTGCPACAGKINYAKQKYYEELERDGLADGELVQEPDWNRNGSEYSLAGQTFERWKVQNHMTLSPHGERKWYCRCECGTERYVLEKSLLNGKSRSCGCIARELVSQKLAHDLTGRTFGDLRVEGRAKAPEGKKGVWWTCVCSCNSRIDVLAANLTTGRYTDCGCKSRHKQARDLKDQSFGQLTALYPTEKRAKNGSVIWACHCKACGNIVEVPSCNLTTGRIIDCGCQRRGQEKGKKNPREAACEHIRNR